MLKRPTVFVIGAGAGVDVAMPVGETLSTEIGDKLDLRYEHGYERTSGHPEVETALKRYVKAREGNYNEWRAAGTTIKKGVHYARSIDNFVNGHRDNEKLAVCAKLGILHTILVYEKHSALFRENRVPSAFRDEAQVRKSWLCDFLHILLNQIVVAENIKQIFNNLCIINFNYDCNSGVVAEE
jgi:hypothetical protein